MTRQVSKSVTTGPDGQMIKTKTVHKDKPKKTVDKVVRKEMGGDSGTKTKSRTKTVTNKSAAKR